MATAASPALDLPVAETRAGFFGFTRAQGILFLAMLAFLIAAPFFLYPRFLMTVLCFALFASAFNLLIGYVGLLSFGHAAFFGMGGYITAHVAKMGFQWDSLTVPLGAWSFSIPLGLSLPPFNPEFAILAGALVGAAMGAVFGWIAIRRQGIYFAMITLALAQMVFFFCVQVPFTHGEDGIQGVPRGLLFGAIDLRPDLTMYWAVLAIFLFGFLLLHRVVTSPFGQVMKAIRENEPRATSLGYRTDDYKLVAFILSAMLAAVAGGTKAIALNIAYLTDVDWHMSGQVVLMTLLGGLGTLFGPVVGAAVIITMQTYLAPFGAWVTVIQGVIFVACVLAFRAGIVGQLANALRIRL
ncbi:branched-chain amino acid ABC transporter permease [Muricoccus radiodurans]|uniref:branched-chain amino acid ABC transporter permease n=1 Tax=Muricoccus radiodurans TaxID=2231721 RepID=UPI003CF3B105